MRRLRICMAGVLVAGGVLSGASARALKPVACDPADAQAYPTTSLSGSLTAEGGARAGALSDKAVVGPVRGQELTVKVAVDYSRPNVPGPDLIWLDFTGKGTFARKDALALRKIPGSKETNYRAAFGPGVASAVHRGKTFPVGVRGMYYTTREHHLVILAFAAAVEGKCWFGNKARPVRFLDATGNFRFTDKSEIAGRSVRPPTGDRVLIDTGDGTFTGSVVKGFYGQPVYVDGAWYEVTISAEQGKPVARRVRRAFGSLSIPNGKWEAVLEGGGVPLLVCGGAEPAAVPAGQYRLVCFRQWSSPDAEGRRAWLLAGLREFANGKAKVVTVAEGRTTTLEIGAPLEMELNAKPYRNRTVKLGTGGPTTKSGLSVMLLTRRGWWVFARPEPPKLRIRDESGKLVDTVSLEYG